MSENEQMEIQVVDDTDPRSGWTSASAALADSLCGGRHQAQKGIPVPDKKDDPDAQFGIRVHAALEKEDPTGLTTAETDAYDDCMALQRAALKQFFSTRVASNMRPLYRERRFWVFVPPSYKHSGQLDKVFRHLDRALIIDYKALRGVVDDSTENMQLRDQATLLYTNAVLLSEIGVTIVQPPASIEPIVTVYTGADLQRATSEMFARVVRSNTSTDRTAGHEQCRFCLATQACDAYAIWNTQRMPAEVPGSIIPPAMWNAEQWNLFLEREGVAMAWLKETKEYAKSLMKENPARIPGWKLQPTGELDTVTDPQELFTRFEKLGGKLPDYMKCLDVGKGKFKELLAATTGAKGKALELALDVLLSGIITSKEKAPAIKRVK